MRVVVAPDKFAGSMTAPEAAAAFERGWRSVAPADDVVRIPLSDGGPGFVECLAESVGGTRRSIGVTGPWHRPVAATVLIAGDTWYIEAAAAHGHGLPGVADPLTGTSAGVGELLAAAIHGGAARVVVGLGGSATDDGGAGMLGALGARARTSSGQEVDLLGGPGALSAVAEVDLTRPRAQLSGVELIVATDVDNPLLGDTGATAVFGPQKGLDDAGLAIAEQALRRWAGACAMAGAPAGAERLPGAGAAGGLGYGLFVLGGVREAGARLVADAVRLGERCRHADLVITGEGSFDSQSLHGKVVLGVLAAAGDVPVVVVAGRNLLAADEWRATGIRAVRTLQERASSAAESIANGPRLMERVAADLAASVRTAGPTRRVR